MNKEIKELGTWNMSDTVQKRDGWDMKTMPEPTANNMQLLMDKINELVIAVNYLNDKK